MVKLGKDNLDVVWLRDNNMADTANLSPDDCIANEIFEDLRVATEQLEETAGDLCGEVEAP